MLVISYERPSLPNHMNLLYKFSQLSVVVLKQVVDEYFGIWFDFS